VLLLCILATQRAAAQAPDGDLPVRDSGVGYIDSAIPGNVLRIRSDGAYGDTHSSRGAFFYARPIHPGLPVPERNIDYQEIRSYLELLFGDNVSLFAEVPVRFLNPDINANTSGLGDINAGVKWAVIRNEDGIWSLQLRTYAPTGDARRGLGTDHVSIEPALLGFIPLGERVAVESELRYLLPLGGGDFAGDLIRYGIGVQYHLWEANPCRLTPVLETVGWTFLNGKDSFLLPDGTPVVNAAAGQTIINLKIGLRVGLGEHFDLYGGWSRPLTGDKFYEHSWRLEVRWAF
jgi:hypothetical protein